MPGGDATPCDTSRRPGASRTSHAIGARMPCLFRFLLVRILEPDPVAERLNDPGQRPDVEIGAKTEGLVDLLPADVGASGDPAYPARPCNVADDCHDQRRVAVFQCILELDLLRLKRAESFRGIPRLGFNSHSRSHFLVAWRERRRNQAKPSRGPSRSACVPVGATSPSSAMIREASGQSDPTRRSRHPFQAPKWTWIRSLSRSSARVDELGERPTKPPCPCPSFGLDSAPFETWSTGPAPARSNVQISKEFLRSVEPLSRASVQFRNCLDRLRGRNIHVKRQTLLRRDPQHQKANGVGNRKPHRVQSRRRPLFRRRIDAGAHHCLILHVASLFVTVLLQLHSGVARWGAGRHRGQPIDGQRPRSIDAPDAGPQAADFTAGPRGQR